jgi:allene oxide cyclase-like protein
MKEVVQMSRNVGAGFALAAATAVALLAVASASGQRGPQVISILAVSETFHLIGGISEDRPPQVGDRFGFGGSLFNWEGRKRGKRIGRFEVLVTATSERGGYLTGTGFLPAGQILIAGFTPFTESSIERYAVIGGTGRYAGARGTVTVRNLGADSDNSALVIRLLP